MAQLAIAAVGAFAGEAIFGAGVVALGLTGAQIGWIAGSVIGAAAFSPTQKAEGPRLGDLTVTGSAYGAPLPYCVGAPRVAGQVVWASKRRELANTSGGKGGGSEVTNYTYDIDILIELSCNEIQGVDKIWSNGKLVWNTSDDADAATLAASDTYSGWKRMTVYTGKASQLPDPVYEADVGTNSALAYRGRGTVFIESLHLGPSGQLPNLTFRLGVGGAVIFMDNFTAEAGRETVTPVSEHLPNIRPTGFFYTASVVVGVLKETVIPVDGTYIHGERGAGTLGYAISVSDSYSSPAFLLSPTFPFKVKAKMQATQRWSGSGTYAYFRSSLDTSTITLGIETTGSPTPDMRRAYAQMTFPTVYTYASPWVAFNPNAPYEIEVTFTAKTMVVTIDGVIVSGALPVPYTPYSPTGPAPFDYVRFALQHYNDDDDAYFDNIVMAKLGAGSSATLSATVAALCLRAGMDASQFDVSDLDSITRPVHALTVMPVPTMRSIIEMLMAVYAFDCVLSDKLYFRARGAASALSIPYDGLGVMADGAALPDPLPLTQSNELEVPAQLALTYNNIDHDYLTDTQTSDRLRTGQESTSTVQVPMGLTPLEAKQSVDRMLIDQAWRLRTQIAIDLAYTKLEPTDVITVTGHDGSTYRLRLLKRTESAGVLVFDAVIDDATVLVQEGITSAGTGSGTGSTTEVAAPANTVLALMDIPILRDADDEPGLYFAMRGTAAAWGPGALYDSLDGTTYALESTLSSQAAIGTASTTLGDWTGGNVFDMLNSVTISLPSFQTLSSYSRDTILSGAAPGYLVGSELLYAQTATLVSTGVYTLGGLLRGRRGTEWAMPGHVADERFVELKTTGEGFNFLSLNASDLGVNRHWKGLSPGQLLSAVADRTLTPMGIGLKPFSPVDARADRTTADTVFSWKRRTRLSTRMLGPLPITPPLGEASESYQVEIYDSSFTTLKRTLTATTPACTYTAAQQATDGTSASVQYIRIYQLSATVGRGYVLQATV